MFAYIAVVVLTARIQPLSDRNDPAKMMAVVSAAPAEFYVRSLLWIACYILTVTMIYALHERMRANAPHLTRAMLIAGSAAVAMVIAESIINLKSVGMIVPTQDLSAFRVLRGELIHGDERVPRLPTPWGIPQFGLQDPA